MLRKNGVGHISYGTVAILTKMLYYRWNYYVFLHIVRTFGTADDENEAVL